MKDNLKSLQMDSYPFLPKPEAPIPKFDSEVNLAHTDNKYSCNILVFHNHLGPDIENWRFLRNKKWNTLKKDNLASRSVM